MPIVRVKTFAESYGVLAKEIRTGKLELAALSGRSRKEWTDFRNQQILSHVGFKPTDRVVDVGCGDGVLLRLLAPRIGRGIGIVPTDSELQVLKDALNLPNVTIEQGLAQALKLESNWADCVICNGVVVLLDTEETVRRVLQELARIIKPGGHAFVGEVPTADEYRRQTEQTKSLMHWLRWEWRVSGKRTFFKSISKLVRATLTSEPLTFISQSHFYCEPIVFARLAQEAGLKCLKQFPTQWLDAEGKVRSGPRYDFLMSKVE